LLDALCNLSAYQRPAFAHALLSRLARLATTYYNDAKSLFEKLLLGVWGTQSR